MNDEMKEMHKELTWDILRYYSGIFLEGFRKTTRTEVRIVILGGLVVIVLSNGSKVHGFKPSQRQWIFKGEKIQSQLPSEGK
jgi:hypothetical protein